ncbi:hypothetical protein DFH09DRAFT_1380700 [Mycena vulgaris]|nr:hypothetical protein DFH09DRAFT_1380700 [Mycena vulgaris]
MDPDPGFLTRSKSRKRQGNEELDGIGIDIEEVIAAVPGEAKYFVRLSPPAKKAKESTPKPKAKAKPKPKPKANAVPKGRKKSTKKNTLPSLDLEYPTSYSEPHSPIAGPSNGGYIEIDGTDSDDDDITGLHSLIPTKHEDPIVYRFKQEDPSESVPRRKARVIPAEPSVEPEPARKATVYVHVYKPVPQLPTKSKSVKPAPPIIAQRGPFFLPLNSDFTAFRSLAQAAGCRPPALNLPLTKWKFEKPGSSKLKALSTDDGYTAMIISLDKRTKDLTIEIHMPPPLLLAEDLPYETDDFKPPDTFEELDVPAVSSVHQQMATLDASLTPVLEQLHSGRSEYREVGGFRLERGGLQTPGVVSCA